MMVENITEAQKEQFDSDGYLIVKGLFSSEEIEQLKNRFMQIHSEGPIPGYFSPLSEEDAKGDILKMYPRIMHPHKIDSLSMKYLLDLRLFSILTKLLEEEPLAAQSMFYYKPPGAKGQALHQDNFYLKMEPGTCIAAWTAIDPSNEENGGLYVVPNSQHAEIQCPHRADPEKSFTREEVDIPDGLKPIPAILEPGDVLFFNGNVIHGSYPNTSKDKFRRSFICHYAGISTTKAGNFYKPLYKQDGTPVTDIETTESNPCGTEFTQAEIH
ncbi:phytanoyl-CoA dioxygenase family protein [Metabacillus elymi]|jgi:phytanoyl-CoA hydroxylase|uniref:Phytanoyl-CoA dioxygenase n=3 Tax=Metabacillus TaxID=2675233 RepID=A0A179SM36_9BACI|nr:phytanoyl-CoA dioxygenase family protein [Metabacillus sp. KUDC1714]OAS82765.1 phytanoyl-CoA dioxygenase [Metabacillus litoralis]QNF30206.1 phytanoyl-CoA dioxygenase family protein [Metabacillus sp. KUDC1714]